MAKVLIVLGSDSDLKRIEACFTTLDDFSIDWDLELCSAHRSPERARDLALNAEANYDLIIAGAGLAAHLPGVLAASTLLPVIGVPLAAGPLNGQDALYSIVQMPPGIPVATVGIDGGKNAAVLALEILALKEPELRDKLREFRLEQARKLEAKNQSIKAGLASGH
ncbi:MAG: 5-(carboxyamino)imidazole ribonucleotide mutase [Eubacteriales bacterium]|nr:5-(carboxyamino)imidazole ribonucleotide mutase [Eubacteriales bacterium]